MLLLLKHHPTEQYKVTAGQACLKQSLFLHISRAGEQPESRKPRLFLHDLDQRVLLMGVGLMSVRTP